MAEKWRCNVVAMTVRNLFPADETDTTVERDADDLPVGFRLFPLGRFTARKGDAVLHGNMTLDKARKIMENYRAKGNRIPIDCEHALYRLSLSMPEETESSLATLLGERGAAGWCELALRADGIWAENVTWGTRARALLQGGEYRFFSPVVRGLTDEDYRITSVALTNQPALDHLDELVATAEWDDAPGMVSGARNGAKKTPEAQGVAKMERLFSALRALLKTPAAIALSDDGNLQNEGAAIAAIEGVRAELDGLRERNTATDAFLGGATGILALSETDGLDVAQGKILQLAERAKSDSEALSAVSTRLEALESDKKAREKEELIARGLQEGKLTQHLAETWAQKQDAAVLTAFLDSAPVVVPPGRQADPPAREEDAAVLSDTDKKVADQLGMTEKEFLEGKQLLAS